MFQDCGHVTDIVCRDEKVPGQQCGYAQDVADAHGGPWPGGGGGVNSLFVGG